MAETELPIGLIDIQPETTDIIIIGGGLAGISAATALTRNGFEVTLISTHDRHPPDFRAEKIAESQMNLFERIGLGDVARAHTTAFDGVWVQRFGRIVERSTTREYSSDYSDLVNTLRRALPPQVHTIIGRVSDIQTGPERQEVILSDGRRFSGRLLVVATGLGDAVRKKLGVEREVLSPAHSLCCGFDLARPRSEVSLSLTCLERRTLQRPRILSDALPDRREDQGEFLPVSQLFRGMDQNVSRPSGTKHARCHAGA